MIDSTFSDETAPSKLPTDVSELGKLIVDQLGRAGFRNTLAGWMSHHVADLMLAAETADEADRSEKRARCAEAILELWTHGDILPDGIRPFQDFEPVFRALACLDPNDATPRYYRSARMPAVDVEENDEVRRWLDCADGLDDTAKLLIRFCIIQASEHALDTSKEWVVAAKAAGAEDKQFLPILRILSDEAELLHTMTPDRAERNEIENRLQRLDGFIEMARLLSDHLRAQLGSEAKES